LNRNFAVPSLSVVRGTPHSFSQPVLFQIDFMLLNNNSPSSPHRTHIRGDQRMYRAVAAKQANPRLALLDALVMGGFVFPELWRAELTDKTTLEADGVSLSQRKNQLSRRL